MAEQVKQENGLHHNLIAMPTGKKASDIVGERHEMVLLMEVAKSNPNGDPDTGNMPRMQPDTMRGLMTDVCLKRKIRNFFSLYHPDGTPLSNAAAAGHRIFIREGAVLQEQMEDGEVKRQAAKLFKEWFLSEVAKLQDEDHKRTLQAAVSGTANDGADQEKLLKEVTKRYQAAWEGKKQKKEAKPGTDDQSATDDISSRADAGKKKKQDPVLETLGGILRQSREHLDCAWRDALCKTYLDVRYFGGVVSTEGPLKGSFYGQIRGPIQMGFAESLDRVLPLEFSITRCASSSEDKDSSSENDEGGNRTMGRKHLVDYAIYRCHVYFSPAFAVRTGFSYYDLDNCLFALKHMFTEDKASARPGGMRVVGLIDFQHSTALGNEHAHKLLDMVKVRRADAIDPKTGRRKEFPQSIVDYCGTLEGMVFQAGTNGSKIHAATVREKDEGGPGNALVTARKIVWEFPDATNEERDGNACEGPTE